MEPNLSEIEQYNEIIREYKQDKNTDKALARLLGLYKQGLSKKIPQLPYSIGYLYHKKGEEEKARFFLLEALDFHETEAKASEILDELETETDEDTERIIKIRPLLKTNVTLNDVVGLDEAKRWIKENIINAVEKRDAFEAFKQKIGAKVIFYGPPGNGKTYIAKAIAGTIDLPFLSVQAQTLIGQYQGVTAKNIHAIMEEARALSPCVLFIDEFEFLGQKREFAGGESRHGGSSDLIAALNTFLEELDGIKGDNEGIFMIGATNRPWMLDSAFTRAGRFGSLVYIPPPNFKQRKEAWQLHLKGKPTKHINYSLLAWVSEGYTQADIAASVEKTITKHIEKYGSTPLSMKELLQTISQEKGSLIKWLQDARRELIGEKKVIIENGKTIEQWEKGSLGESDKAVYEPLLKDLVKMATPTYFSKVERARTIAHIFSFLP